VQLYDFFSHLVGAPEFHSGAAPEIAGVKVIDDLTLEATLTGPWAPFLTIATAQYILPKHILESVEVDKIAESSFARAPIGTGPFVFENWEADNFITSKAFDNYWRGRPTLDTLIQRALTLDNNTVIPSLENGETNTAGLSLQVIDTLSADPPVTVRNRPGAANQYIEFNLDPEKSPFFQDLRVRKALSYALNRQAIVDAVWQGRAKVYNSVFPYDWWATKQDTTIFDNDPEQAKALLDEAGWLVGSDGVREKDGVKFSFLFQANTETWPLVVQQQWKEIGVDTQFEYITFQTFSEQYYLAGNFHIYGMNVPYSLYADPHYSLPGYFLSANNRNKYNNPKSDELIIAAASTYDIEERKKFYYEWQELIAQDIPHLWIANPDVAYAYTKGLITPERSGSYWESREVWDWYWAED
jgi:peptide/nickel transport system substrate-binding protein